MKVYSDLEKLSIITKLIELYVLNGIDISWSFGKSLDSFNYSAMEKRIDQLRIKI